MSGSVFGQLQVRRLLLLPTRAGSAPETELWTLGGILGLEEVSSAEVSAGRLSRTPLPLQLRGRRFGCERLSAMDAARRAITRLSAPELPWSATFAMIGDIG